MEAATGAMVRLTGASARADPALLAARPIAKEQTNSRNMAATAATTRRSTRARGLPARLRRLSIRTVFMRMGTRLA
jgi:hypothetical protein